MNMATSMPAKGAVLFSMSDLPIIEAAGLYREEEGEGQEIIGELG